jgi:hypothetical protein
MEPMEPSMSAVARIPEKSDLGSGVFLQIFVTVTVTVVVVV